MINVVLFNGGRGARNLVTSLLGVRGLNLTSVVNAYDDGKSTGEIRKFFKMLGPSDIRKVQEIMIPSDLLDYEAVVKLFEYRYAENADHDVALGELRKFAKGENPSLVGIEFKDIDVQKPLRTLVGLLVDGIDLIEKIEMKRLNFSDCSLMNLIYAGAFLYFHGNFEEATHYIDKLFKLKGTVLATSNDDRKLVAIREDGHILNSEAEIVELRSNVRLRKIYLMDQYPDRTATTHLSQAQVEAYFELMHREVSAGPKVVRSIFDADIIIYAPGTQHSSLYPTYMAKGLGASIANNKKALKILITNIGEDYETPRYTASDFINGALKYLTMTIGFKVAPDDLISYAFVNKKFSSRLESYVQFDEEDLRATGCPTLIDDFEDEKNPGKHDGAILAKRILELYSKRCLRI